MAYCPECGLFYHEAVSSCDSCGHDLTNLSEQDRVAKTETSQDSTLDNSEVLKEEVNEPEVAPGLNETDSPEIIEVGAEEVGVVEETVGEEVAEVAVEEEASAKVTAAASEIADEEVSPTEALETAVSDQLKESEVEFDQNVEVAETDPSSGETGMENSEFGSPVSGFAESEAFINQRETQLGRGIIKPSSVEFSQDGAHFKYDELAQTNRVKAEPFRERVTELRVSGEEVINGSGDAELQEVKNSNVVMAVELPNESVNATPEVTQLDATEPPTLVADDTTIEVTDDQPISRNENVVVSQAVEPETKPVPPKVEIFWEEQQSPQGLNSACHYCITNEMVQVSGPGKRGWQIPLTAIKVVSLNQSWWGRLVNKGSILITLVDQEQPQVLFSGIKQPGIVKKLLDDLILAKV